MNPMAPEQTCTGKLKDRGEEARKLQALADQLDGMGLTDRAHRIRRDLLRMQEFWRFELALEPWK